MADPKKKKKIRVIESLVGARKPKFDAKPAALKERSQVAVIQKAATNNASAGDKSVGQFTRAAIKGGLSRGDVKFKGKLGFKSMPSEKMGGTILKKDRVENVTVDRYDGTKENVKLVNKKGELDRRKPADAQVASRTRLSNGRMASRSIRTVDKASEVAIVRGTDRNEALKSFKTGTGKKPKDKRRRKIKVLG